MRGVSECPDNRMGGGEMFNDNAGLWHDGGKFVVLCGGPNVMRKQALRAVKQIDKRRSEQAIGRKTTQ